MVHFKVLLLSVIVCFHLQASALSIQPELSKGEVSIVVPPSAISSLLPPAAMEATWQGTIATTEATLPVTTATVATPAMLTTTTPAESILPAATTTTATTTTTTLLEATTSKSKKTSQHKTNNNNNNVVSRIFFINLDSRPDRLAWIKHQLHESAPHIQAVRFPAIKVNSYDDAKSDPEYQNIFKNWDVSEGISTGHQHNSHFAVSVFLSHITLYNRIIQQKLFDSEDDLVMVLEDDVQLVPNWSEKLSAALPNIPTDWEILRIGHWGATRAEDVVHPGVFAARPPFWVEPATAYYGGAHAVVLRVKMIPSLLEHLRHVPIGDVDGMMTSCCSLLRSYVLEEELVTIVENGSDNPDHH